MMGSGGQGSRVETMTRVCISMTPNDNQVVLENHKGIFYGKEIKVQGGQQEQIHNKTQMRSGTQRST